MTLLERLSRRFVSFELLPPRTPESAAALADNLVELAALQPAFIAVTYGAGGSSRERSAALVESLSSSDVAALPHLTCAAHRRDELVKALENYRAMGVDNLLALHGDPPLSSDVALPEGDLRFAVELVALARTHGMTCVGVAVHPEGHPAAPDRDTDLSHQAAKLREADFALTQFVNRSSDYFEFVDAMHARGADAPVIPGIRPIVNLRQAQRMAEMSGAQLPPRLVDALAAAGDDKALARRIGIEFATEVCQALLDGGAPGLHFYTLNRADVTLEVCAALS